MPATLECAALLMAMVQKNPVLGLIVYSDRVVPDDSAEYQALLARHGLVGGVNRGGNCWDNAVTERPLLDLKKERVWQKDYAIHAEAADDIADCIVRFHDSIRLHSKLGNLSPNALKRESTSKKST